ncbi:MAG: PA14 domain-containing protein [Candidatus Promineifilaceae bacterium]
MESEAKSEGGQGFLASIPIWLVIVLAGVLLVAVILCLVLFFGAGGDSEPQQDGLPTLMPTAGVPVAGISPEPQGTSESPSEGTSVLELAATYTPITWPITPTATISGSEMTATTMAETATSIAATATAAATLTPQPTPTNTTTRLPVPTRTRYIPPPPVTFTPQPTPFLTSTPIPTPLANIWAGKYFANQNLSGGPTVFRTDANILFDWGTGSPDPSIPADHFSVRWDRTVNLSAGSYRFSAFSDDGVRVYLDGQLIINQWHTASNTIFTADRTVSSGNHTLRVDYYEDIGTAQIQFWWELISSTSPAWRGEYFNNMTLSGSPTVARNDQEIFFNWGTGSPASGIPADNFSVRWTREAGFNAGTYRFIVHPDDGVRVWVDNQLIIDQWHDATATIYSAALSLSSGVHTIRVEYYENLGDAQIQFWWELDGAYPNWRGAYFTNADLNGAPTVTRNDVSINFSWGSGSPASGIPADNFSVRWIQGLYFSEGTYVFHARVDDGVRIYVDGALVVNDWRDGSLREVSGDVELTSGQHVVRVEYYERIDQATIEVWWEQVASPYPDWTGEYFDVIIEPDATVTPVFVRTDTAIDFNWGSGSPGTGIPNDNFSVRWTRSNEYNPGIYRLSAQSDDGVRVYMNGVKVIDEWHQSTGQETYTVERPISAGVHTIVVEYYEGTGDAIVRFWMQRISNLP